MPNTSYLIQLGGYSDAIKFSDEHGRKIEMYDFSQCEKEAPLEITRLYRQPRHCEINAYCPALL